MSQASISTMTRATQGLSALDTASQQSNLSLREFVVDDDAAHYNSALWKTIDQNAYILAQREAIEAFNVAKALRLSEETAAVENQRRAAAAARTSEAQASSSSSGRSHPISIKKDTLPPQNATDEAAARSLARSWQVDALQPALLEKSSSSPPSKPRSSNHDKRAPSSITKQNSQNLLSLSQPSDSRHSRSTSQSNAQSSSSHTHRPEQRSFSKREPSGTDEPSGSTPSSQVQVSDVTNTKRRRTERKQSISSPDVVVTPPMLQSKKSTASARDLRLGMIMNPAKENPTATQEPRARRNSTHQNSNYRDLFTATRNCARCGNLMSPPRVQLSTTSELPSFCDLLHVTCSKCATSHCRGCSAVSKCPRQCSGGHGCAVRNCCPDVRAIAIFEALSSFDQTFATEAGFAGVNGKQQRQAYIKLLISKADKSMRKFEDAFVRILRLLCSWLQASSDDEKGRALHPAVARLFTASFLPEVLQGFMSNNNVRDWIAHSETYIVVLETLRRMFDCGLSSVLTDPLHHVDQSCGLQRWVWDQGSITWEPAQSLPLCDLVKQLEAHRRPLRALGEKVQFSATLEKVNSLCDGISYLLLQQVVGGS
ncbi:hypothetical protein B0H34DRAFT_791971 [Crassisporium funariophilum]|nr:hypothetical protein B0H34DRAFT_791971 [Crassisporium funariophilum]